MLFNFTVVFVSYLFGSINFAILFAKLFKLQDPRTVGSNNPGATNIARYANKYVAGLVLFADGMKGAIVVFVASLLIGSREWALIALAGVIIGHVFPVFYGFKGGKGVATSFGGLYFYAPLETFVITVIWLVTYRIFKISFMGALTSFLLLPIIFFLTGRMIFEIVFTILLLMAILSFHWKNISEYIKNKKVS